MAATENRPFVEVFGGSRWEAEVIKGLLEANNIKSFVKDETMSSVTSPYLGVGGEVKILVDEADCAVARQLIKDKNQTKED